tara:strand:- start:694 stop:897 length:204 start_codon:yes stop_codon:yes gene_type:complete
MSQKEPFKCPLYIKVVAAFTVGLSGYMMWIAFGSDDIFPDEGVKWMFLIAAGIGITLMIGTFKGWCD